MDLVLKLLIFFHTSIVEVSRSTRNKNWMCESNYKVIKTNLTELHLKIDSFLRSYTMSQKVNFSKLNDYFEDIPVTKTLQFSSMLTIVPQSQKQNYPQFVSTFPPAPEWRQQHQVCNCAKRFPPHWAEPARERERERGWTRCVVVLLHLKLHP